MPDYDGRGNPDTDADSWALWIPRIALSPLYLTNEYVLRRPLGALVRKAERDRWADTFVQLFTFGEGGKNVLVPTALFDFGLLPSVGFYYAGDDFLAPGNTLRIHGASNAFGARLDGFAAEKLRMSGDFGFTTSPALDQGFELRLGVGTETFEQGAAITSLRVTVGSRRGF